MQELGKLLENYWIDREEDRELFNQVRREVDGYRRFCQEQLGWRLLQNEYVIKLEKVPARALGYMGIRDFTDTRDYVLLCALLIFLDDKEDHEQFLLSELITVLEAQLRNLLPIDWTNYSLRRCLIRVLQFAEKRRLVLVDEGKSEDFDGGGEHEVLYENSGLARYFVTNFGTDIFGFTSYRDFEQPVLEGIDTNRGALRVNRVYRRLAAEPALYWQEASDSDAVYLKNQRASIAANLEKYLGGQLQVQRNCAFWVLEEEESCGEQHPPHARMILPDIVQLFSGYLYEAVKSGRLTPDACGRVELSGEQLEELLQGCRNQTGTGWSSTYRAMSTPQVLEEVRQYLLDWEMADAGPGEGLVLLPGAVKVSGSYPASFEAEVART
jgi:uncharacterized protein (TIGR02678 family)